MFIPTAPVTVDCEFLSAARVGGAALLGLAIVALEASLRMPVRPLLDVALQEGPVRFSALVRKLSV